MGGNLSASMKNRSIWSMASQSRTMSWTSLRSSSARCWNRPPTSQSQSRKSDPTKIDRLPRGPSPFRRYALEASASAVHDPGTTQRLSPGAAGCEVGHENIRRGRTDTLPGRCLSLGWPRMHHDYSCQGSECQDCKSKDELSQGSSNRRSHIRILMCWVAQGPLTRVALSLTMICRRSSLSPVATAGAPRPHGTLVRIAGKFRRSNRGPVPASPRRPH